MENVTISGGSFGNFSRDTAVYMDKSQKTTTYGGKRKGETSEEKKEQKAASDTSKFGFEKVEGIEGNN